MSLIINSFIISTFCSLRHFCFFLDVMSCHFKISDTRSCGVAIHGKNDVYCAIKFLLRGCGRDVRFCISPLLHHLQILIEALVRFILTVFQLPKRAYIMNNIFQIMSPLLLRFVAVLPCLHKDSKASSSRLHTWWPAS